MKKALFAIKNNQIAASIIGAILLIGAGVWYVAANRPPTFNTVTVGHANVVESVDEPGNVLAENDATLSFQEAGQIDHVYVNEGDVVSAGAPLVALDVDSLSALADQANAALAAAQAKLDGLQVGTRPEEITIDQSSVQTAQTALVAAIGNAYTSADDAVHNQTDNLFMNPRGNAPVLQVPVTDSQLQINIQADRVALESSLAAWYAANASTTDAATLSNIANNTLHSVKQYLDAVALGVNEAIPSGNVSPTTLATYKADVVTARTEVATAITTVTTAEASLTSAQNQLILAQAGATSQDIEGQKAAVLQAQAAAANAQVALDHATLRAPFAGTVRDLTAKIGQVVAPSVPVLALTNSSGLKIEAYVSETDIAKVGVNDPANITLDAYGTDAVFPGTVTTIDTAETTLNGSPAYKVTLHFAKPDDRVKAGMTANVHIIAAEHDNVLAIPARLVIEDGDQRFVLVRNGGTVEKQPVTLGITGDDGMVEVVSGLSGGETISNF